MKTSVPCAAMPFEKPLARAHPGGWRICMLIFLTPQLEALQLSGLGARQRVDELDRARVLVWRDNFFHVFLQLAHGALPLRIPASQHHEGFDDRAALGI